jgi:hypothetical protein
MAIPPAAALSLGGVSPNVRSFAPPAPDGLLTWLQFTGTNWNAARKNLIMPAHLCPVTDPPPVLAGAYAEFPGSVRSVDSLFAETASMTILAVIQCPSLPGGAGLARIVSNNGRGAGGGFTFWVSSTGVLKAAVLYEGEGGADTTGGIAGLIAGKWYLVSLIVENGVGWRMQNLTDGTSYARAKTTARAVPDNLAFRVGTSGVLNSTTPLPIDIHALSNADRAVGLDELDANVAAARARAAAVGITL